MATFTLVPEIVQGEVILGPIAIPAVLNAMISNIKMLSTVFGSDNTLSFRLLVEESLDNIDWIPASGFPLSSIGGNAGVLNKNGTVNDGLLGVQYFYDGNPKSLRVTGIPFTGGTPLHIVDGILANSVLGSFDWGLTVTII